VKSPIQIPHWHAIVHAGQSVLTFIGGGAVLGFIGWLYTRKQESFEDSILLMLQTVKYDTWRSAAGIHADYGRKYLSDVPAWVIIPPANVNTGWRRLKWWLRTVPYQARHLWRKKFFVPSLRKVEKAVLRLWKKGLLVRNDLKPGYYRLKP
jgi:hypothetical protein